MSEIGMPEEFGDGSMGLPVPPGRGENSTQYTTIRRYVADTAITVGIRVNGTEYDNISNLGGGQTLDDIWTSDNDDVDLTCEDI